MENWNKKIRTLSTKTVNLSLDVKLLFNENAALKTNVKTPVRKVAAKTANKDAELHATIDKQKQQLRNPKAENKAALKEKDKEMNEWKKQFEAALW